MSQLRRTRATRREKRSVDCLRPLIRRGRNIRSFAPLCLLVALAAAVFLIPLGVGTASASAEVLTWMGNADHEHEWPYGDYTTWEDPENWMTESGDVATTAPGEGDVAVFITGEDPVEPTCTISSNVTVSCIEGIGTLTITSGKLTLASGGAPSTVTSIDVESGASLDNSGDLTISTAGISITGSAALTVSGSLTNSGTLHAAGMLGALDAIDVECDSSQTGITNESGGTIDLQGGVLGGNSGGTTPAVVNSGTVQGRRGHLDRHRLAAEQGHREGHRRGHAQPRR